MLGRFKNFKVLVGTQSKHKIKVFWSDNDKKFVSKAFNYFLKIPLLRSKRLLRLRVNKTEWQTVRIVPSYKEYVLCPKPRHIILN